MGAGLNGVKQVIEPPQPGGVQGSSSDPPQTGPWTHLDDDPLALVLGLQTPREEIHEGLRRQEIGDTVR